MRQETSYHCPGCGAHFILVLGTLTRCPECGHSIRGQVLPVDKTTSPWRDYSDPSDPRNNHGTGVTP